MSPVDQHGTDGQTHGRAGGVLDAQTGSGERPMIHWRRTAQIAPGRQNDAIARGNEWVAIWKDHGVRMRISVSMTGDLGRLCQSWEFQSMEAYETVWTAFQRDPRAVALWTKRTQEVHDGVPVFVDTTMHDEWWRDA